MKLSLLNPYAKILIALSILLMMTGTSFAHRVNVFAWVEGDTIHVESKFSGGRRVSGGRIVVMDPQGVELHAGLTDEQGRYSFVVPQKSDLRIILVAGQGHQGEWTIREAELEGSTAKDRMETGAETVTLPEPGNALPNKSGDPGRSIMPEELEAVIETVLDRKLKPITRMLADLRPERPAVKDIFAGIGYILGLVGIAAYVHGRRKKE